MAKTTVEVLVDDLDGSEGAATVQLGWDGEWRELELSKKNRASLIKALDKYWSVARPVAHSGQANPRSRKSTGSRSKRVARDPKAIRAWAAENGVAIPARGRIPRDVERRYNDASGRPN
jgi:hypothetical protein